MGRVFRLWVAVVVAVGHAQGPAVADDRVASDGDASAPTMTVRKPAPQGSGGFVFPAVAVTNASDGGARAVSSPPSPQSGSAQTSPQSGSAAGSGAAPPSGSAIDDLRRRAAGWSDDVARQAGDATRNAVRSLLPGEARETIRGDQAVVVTPGRDEPRAGGTSSSGFATGGALVADPVGPRPNGPSTAPSSGSQSPWYTHADAAGRAPAPQAATASTGDAPRPPAGQAEPQNLRGDPLAAETQRFDRSAPTAAGDGQSSLDQRDPRLAQDPRGFQDPRLAQDSRGFQDPPLAQDPRGFQDPPLAQDPRGFQDPRLAQDSRGFQDPRLAQDPRGFDGRGGPGVADDSRSAAAGGFPSTSVTAPAARPNLSPSYADDPNADPRWGVTSTFGRMPQGLARPAEAAAPPGAYPDGYFDRDDRPSSTPPRGRVALAERSADRTRSSFDVDERATRDDDVPSVRTVAEREDATVAPRRRESLRDQNPIAGRDPAALDRDERVDRRRAVKTVAAQPVFNGLLLFSFVANIYLAVWLKNLRQEFREMVASKRAARSSA